MNLYNLGSVPWLDSQLIYHALPRLNMEGLVLLAPAEPYVCIGYHQDALLEVDLDYCREHDIPVFRREVGGGATFLDGRQLFFQLVIHKDNPLIPATKEECYRRFLEPVAQTYRDLGVQARYRPVNDIITAEGRKISGSGAAEIGEFFVMVGNLIQNFDYETMVRVLRVPDEKFRDKVHKSLYENLSTLRREVEREPSWQEMIDALVRNFDAVIGPLTPATLPPKVKDQVAELIATHTTEEWLLKPGKRFQEKRQVKIATGVEIVQRAHKAPGGLIRATAEVRNGVLESVGFSGDFFLYPEDKVAELEEHLTGVRLADAEREIAAFYQAHQIESPGVTPRDLATALGAE